HDSPPSHIDSKLDKILAELAIQGQRITNLESKYSLKFLRTDTPREMRKKARTMREMPLSSSKQQQHIQRTDYINMAPASSSSSGTEEEEVDGIAIIQPTRLPTTRGTPSSKHTTPSRTRDFHL